MNQPIGSKTNFRLEPSWLDKRIILKKIRNTFLNLHFLWPLVIHDKDFEDVLNPSGSEVSASKALLLKIFRFWPRVMEARNWSAGDIGVHGCDPSDFRELDPLSVHLIDSVMSRASSKDEKILDLGCNCGRFLARLAENGFNHLYGVDVSAKALEYMGEWFPILAGKAHVTRDLFQRYLSARQDREFDIVFSRGATVELVHPSYPLIRELCRVTGKYVVLLISENMNRYPRFWEYEFRREGFVPVEVIRPVTQLMNDASYEQGHTLTLLVFRRFRRP